MKPRRSLGLVLALSLPLGLPRVGLGASPGIADPTGTASPDIAALVGPENESVVLPGAVVPTEPDVGLDEVSGARVCLRITPLDDDGAPLDGGRVVTLKPFEHLVVRLADVLPAEDIQNRQLRVETISGSGRARVAAPWLTPGELAAVAVRPPRHRLEPVVLPSSSALIDAAESNGTLDHETAVLYRVYAIFSDARLPAAYHGNDRSVRDSLYLPTVASEFDSYSTATQLALAPFLMPPAYVGSWDSPAGTSGSQAQAATVSNFDPCGDVGIFWSFKENPSGHVRVWYREADDAAQAATLATIADTTLWPKYATLLGRTPLADGGTKCSGGSDRLDIYLSHIDRAYTSTLTTDCTKTPAFITMNRADPLWVLVHEMFHAFQFAFHAAACLRSPDYAWWSEGGAVWAQDYVYPYDQGEQYVADWFLPHPDWSLDYSDDEHVYGSYLFPFFLSHSLNDTTFIRKTWEACDTKPAVDAMDGVIPGGFAQQWPLFALDNWNDVPAIDYQDWDQLYYEEAVVTPRTEVILNAAPVKEYPVDMDLAKLTATYSHFVFDDANVHSVAFWNGASYNLQEPSTAPLGPAWNPAAASADKKKGVKVQAMYKLRTGGWQIADWTDKPYVTFCRDISTERIDELVLVISNSDFADASRHATPEGDKPRLFASGMGCWQWKGSATWTETASGTTQQDVADVTFTRVEGQPSQPSVSYLPTGTVTVTFSGTCTGKATVPISGTASLLTTYNYLPRDNTQASQAYSGEGVETGMVDITCQGMPGKAVVGPWLLIPPGTPPAFPFFKAAGTGARLHDSFAQSGERWEWDLSAQSQP